MTVFSFQTRNIMWELRNEDVSWRGSYVTETHHDLDVNWLNVFSRLRRINCGLTGLWRFMTSGHFGSVILFCYSFSMGLSVRRSFTELPRYEKMEKCNYHLLANDLKPTLCYCEGLCPPPPLRIFPRQVSKPFRQAACQRPRLELELLLL
jgi:hypothetical protein